jgi:tetratricopeptide (TPR) repeat protein
MDHKLTSLGGPTNGQRVCGRPHPPTGLSDNRRQTGLICAGLALAAAAAYWPLRQCGFVNFDDYDYVVNNDAIQHGLNGRAIAWAFTTTRTGNWHPLTWISHILDFQLYGWNAAGHHATSLLLHLANSILLFLLLKRMTGAMWPGAVTAALFALHPMHVESVAWISERKDVLSAFFWMLSLWAYLGFVAEAGIQGTKPRAFYSASLAFFALGLMCKPMVMTLPLILLLLDYWPLERWRRPRARLWMEKVPFFVLAAASGVVTMAAQRQGRSVLSLEQVPLAARLENLPMGCARYVGKLFWPARLAAMYPYVFRWPAWEVAGAGVFLAVVTVWVIWRARAQPFLAVGWLWFLGGLAPVNGLVQAGFQSIADRYTYLPSIGLFIMAVWTVGQWKGKLGRLAAAVLAAAALAGCLYLTPRQAGYWRDTRTLFAHAVESTSGNYFACASLGRELAAHGQQEAAIEYLDKAVSIAPWLAMAQSDLGRALLDAGRVDDALPHLQRAAALRPETWEDHYNLGNALLARGRVAEALDQFQTQVRLRPEDAAAQLNLGAVLLDNNRLDDAIPHLEKAAGINPSDAEAHYKLGSAYFLKGRAAEAVGQYEKSLQIRPDYAAACNNLAWILGSSPEAALRNGARAVELASRADRLLGGKNPLLAGTLAVACAEAGKYSEAVAAASRAREFAEAQKDPALAQWLDELLALFRAGKPFRDTARLSTGDGK